MSGSVRGYVPLTLPQLASVVAAGHVALGESVVWAVDDSEDAEYEALCEAAEAAVEPVGELPPDLRRRVVVVVASRGDGRGDGRDREVAWSDVLAVHADLEPIDLDGDELPELGWFGVQEVPDLLAEE